MRILYIERSYLFEAAFAWDIYYILSEQMRDFICKCVRPFSLCHCVLYSAHSQLAYSSCTLNHCVWIWCPSIRLISTNFHTHTHTHKHKVIEFLTLAASIDHNIPSFAPSPTPDSQPSFGRDKSRNAIQCVIVLCVCLQTHSQTNRQILTFSHKHNFRYTQPSSR